MFQITLHHWTQESLHAMLMYENMQIHDFYNIFFPIFNSQVERAEKQYSAFL